MQIRRKRTLPLLASAALLGSSFAVAAADSGPKRPGNQPPAVHVTFAPYLQPGDNGPFGTKDQIVVAWQTDETTVGNGFTVSYSTDTSYSNAATVVGRVVDNYLAGTGLPIPPTAYGAHINYYAVLPGLDYNTTYNYKVTGPGLPANGFTAAFHTRKRPQDGVFSFEVQGDEGFYPSIPNSSLIENWEARIVHSMLHVDTLQFSTHTAAGNQPFTLALPKPDFALNTGDNVYTVGADANYRDFWFGNWNSDPTQDENDDGAPFIRSILLWATAGNHDVGSTGASANLLNDSLTTVPGGSGAGRFGGGLSGGDAMQHFNNFYYSLNGPVGADIQNVFSGDTSTPTGFYLKQNGGGPDLAPTQGGQQAIANLRASTTVNTGNGDKRQIDHMSNYSFDYGNAHFVFLDANPHNFGGFLPGGPPTAAPSFPFTPYPALLRQWLINDLDSTNQTWKIVVYHQPGFSSGNATIANDQMRAVATFLEDHGVNFVFNGHDHNYQRSLPLHVIGKVAATPRPLPAPPVLALDTAFDGKTNTVPQGVLYFVEGTGGDRDFDNDLPNPRGSGFGVDQDDAATDSYTTTINAHPYTFAPGPPAWVDTNLTDDAMKAFLGNMAGKGPKITKVMKTKLFGFADIIVNGNTLTLYQISEPLGTTTSAGDGVFPYGVDLYGNPANDPLPETHIDPITGNNVQTTGFPGTGSVEGTHTLLDQITVTRADVTTTLNAKLSAPGKVNAGSTLVYTVAVTNNTPYNLTGTQAVVTLPTGVTFADTVSNNLTQQWSGGQQTAVITIGYLPTGGKTIVQVKTKVTAALGSPLTGSATVRSATAQSVSAGSVTTTVSNVPPPPGP